MKKYMSLIAISLALTLVFFTLPAFAKDKDVIVIKLASLHPVRSRVTSDFIEPYCQEIEKRTNGKVKFKKFLACSLVNFNNCKKGLLSGLVDMVIALPVYVYENEYPVSKLLQTTFLCDDPAHLALTYYTCVQEVPEMRAEYQDLKALGFFCTAATNFHFKKVPAKSLEDMQGKKIWCGSKGQVDACKLYGASPRLTKIQDVYMSLQRGMVDAVSFPDAPLRGYKLTDLLAAHTIGNFGSGVHFNAMSLKKWKTLPPDVQKVFEDLTLSSSCLGGAVLKNEADFVNAELKKRGDVYYYLTPEQKARWYNKLEPMRDEWTQALDKKGMDGKAVLNKITEKAEYARQHPYKEDSWWGRAGRKE